MNAFLVAGTASGVGKTTVALAIMAGLRARGLVVQPFKCGPDFIDPGHHNAICNRSARNLDTWMLSAEANRRIFSKACSDADVAVVEGMMGLFDGVAGGSDAGSSAEIAKLLDLPVVLVLDAGQSARSIAAVVRGFEVFDPELHIAAVVLNQVAGHDHFRMLESAIGAACTSPIAGRLPRDPTVAIAERHLGLHTAIEDPATQSRFGALADLAGRHLNLDMLARIGPRERLVDQDKACSSFEDADRVRVGVARDRAFSFYYEDNLDALRELGAEIVEWSPLFDERLPPELDALYLGGGYPELYAEQLSSNRKLIDAVCAFAKEGKPLYAECGGMMYLAQTLYTLDGSSFSMAGVLPIVIEMTGRLLHFGYTDVEFSEDCLLGEKGTFARGHSFHCSRVVEKSPFTPAYRIHYSLSGKHSREGYCRNNLLASYIHLHFRSNPSLAQSLMRKAHAARHLRRVAS